MSQNSVEFGHQPEEIAQGWVGVRRVRRTASEATEQEEITTGAQTERAERPSLKSTLADSSFELRNQRLTYKIKGVQ